MSLDSDGNNDVLDQPLRLHDHPNVIKPPREKYKTRAPFTDQQMVDSLSQQIKDRMSNLNWDDAKLAITARVYASSVNRIRTGSIKEMDLTTALRIIKALGLRIDLIIND